MSLDALIERRAAEALAEIAKMGRAAREDIDRKLAFFRRSQGQKRRFARARLLQGVRK